MKWLVLAAGLFLVFNGSTSRTYSYEDPPKHCFQMDYINVYGCFASPAVPALITWGSLLTGAVLVGWFYLRTRRRNAPAADG